MRAWWQDRGQRRYPREFGIPRPLWPDEAQALAARVDAALAAVGSDYEHVAAALGVLMVRPAPEPDGPLGDDALADAALGLWRTDRRISVEDPDRTCRRTRRLRRHVDTAWHGLGWAGITVHEHDNEPYYDGLNLKVAAREACPGLSRETVIETVAPSILRAKKVIRPGEVIVGYPVWKGGA